jgi:hypothetical protein
MTKPLHTDSEAFSPVLSVLLKEKYVKEALDRVIVAGKDANLCEDCLRLDLADQILMHLCPKDISVERFIEVIQLGRTCRATGKAPSEIYQIKQAFAELGIDLVEAN